MPVIPSLSLDSVEAGAPASEIEITPAMVSAGTAALSRLLPDKCGWADAEFYAEVVLKAALGQARR